MLSKNVICSRTRRAIVSTKLQAKEFRTFRLHVYLNTESNAVVDFTDLCSLGSQHALTLSRVTYCHLKDSMLNKLKSRTKYPHEESRKEPRGATTKQATK